MTESGDAEKKVVETTVGRVVFSEIWPEELGFPNRVIGKSQLGDLIWRCYKVCGHEKTVATLDRLKELGFREATKAVVSIGIDDMIIPKEKGQEIETAQKQINEVEKQYRKGVITPGERYNKIIDIWTHCTDQIANVMLRTLETNHNKAEYNPVSLMVDSGARGNRQQVRQLAGVRGLMAKPSGDIIEKPILSNFREGLTVLEYFISTHGARKGLADTALKTADSGYMTRKLVDVAQDVIIREQDCGTTNGIWVQAIYEGEDEVVKLADRLIGRYSCDDIKNPQNPKESLAKANEEIDELKAKAVDTSGVEKVKIRSVLTCESKHGICMYCYGRKVKKCDTFVQWDPYYVPILSEKAGKVRFHDIIEGVTMKQELDEQTQQEAMVIIEHKEDLHPQIIISDEDGEPVANYPIPSGAHIVVNEDDKIVAGTLMAKTPRKQSKTKDITGGLPRVAELFEARRPKDASEIAKIDGTVEMGGTVRGKRRLILKDPETGAEEEHLIPITKHIIVFKGDFVKKGQQLTEGPVVPHEILEVCGPQDLQEHLVNEVQEVYRLQGVEINDKHIEIIVRQMLRKVKITDPGDTSLLWGDQVDRLDFEQENKKVVEKGGKPAEAVPVLLGITKASLETDSFISAASFQDTTRVLTEAATLGKVDKLRGFKENVIMGHLIPAGTGFAQHREIKLVEKGDPVGADDMEED